MDPEILSTITDVVPPELVALGLTLTALSGTFYFIWGIIGPWVRWIKNTLFNLVYREIEIHISNPDYNKFNAWLESHKSNTYLQRSFSVVANLNNSVDEFEYEPDPIDSGDDSSKLVAGFGSVFIKEANLPWIMATRAKQESAQIFRQTETLTFRLFSITEKPIHKFFDQVLDIQQLPGPYVYVASHSYWSQNGKLKTVLPPLGYGAYQFIELVRTFLNSRHEYEKRGLAYKMGALLEGEPGTGKTSIVAYVAAIFGLNVYLLNSEAIIKFDELRPSIKPHSIVFIDDIDMTVAGQGKRHNILGSDKPATNPPIAEDKDNKLMTSISNDIMRDFMNTLDGICEFDGCIIVGNTNNPDVLDSALIRPGRFDHRIVIGPYTYREQIRHINRFYGTSLDEEHYHDIPDRTVAEIQKLCVANMYDVDNVLMQL